MSEKEFMNAVYVGRQLSGNVQDSRDVNVWHKSEIDRLTRAINVLKKQEPDSPDLEPLRAKLRAHLIDLDLEEPSEW